MTNELARQDGGPRAVTKEPEVVQLLNRMGPEIARALPRHVTPERMMRVALTALRSTPDLLKCSTASVLGSIMSVAQLGLEPNTPLGLAYLVPYKGRCQVIIGYQGFMELARRSGLVSAPYAYVVRAGDEFRYTLGLNPTLVHVPLDKPDREDKPITHVYAVAHILPKDSAPPIFVVLTAAQVRARRNRSAAKSSGPWVTDEEAMTLKTAIRALWRWLPKTAEMAAAAQLDDAEGDSFRAQADAWDPATIEAMREQGVQIDVTAGEVLAEAREAEAGSKGERVLAAIAAKKKPAEPAPSNEERVEREAGEDG